MKAAGGATAAAAPVAAPAAAAAPAPAQAPAAPVGVEPPVLIEITDDMSPEDVRKARVANAKANSAYNKALKAAGIDPASLKAGAVAGAAVAAEAVTRAPEPVVAATSAADDVEPAQDEIESVLKAGLESAPADEAAKFNAAIGSIKEILPEVAEKLQAAGVTTIDLLRLGATPKGRAQIASASKLDESTV
ncbi:MAG: hypothetical protein R3C44_09090 [Chloroflexota bacterium]